MCVIMLNFNPIINSDSYETNILSFLARTEFNKRDSEMIQYQFVSNLHREFQKMYTVVYGYRQTWCNMRTLQKIHEESGGRISDQ